jgi:hypothetical protein
VGADPTNFGFARQNRLGNTTCRYEGIRFEGRAAVHLADEFAVIPDQAVLGRPGRARLAGKTGVRANCAPNRK